MRTSLPVAALLLLPLALPAGEDVDYMRQVKPLLKERCYACHGPLKQRAKLRLDTAASLRKGGTSGPAVEPGMPQRSLLLERVTAREESERMPPEGKPLTPAEIAMLSAWIKQGAKAPADEKQEVDPRQHWAFVPPVRP